MVRTDRTQYQHFKALTIQLHFILSYRVKNIQNGSLNFKGGRREKIFIFFFDQKSIHPSSKKYQKSFKNRPNWTFFSCFGLFPQLRGIGFISRLLLLFRHKFRIATRHTLKFFLSLYRGVSNFVEWHRGMIKLRQRAEIFLVAPDPQSKGKMHSDNLESNFLDFDNPQRNL